MERKIALDHGKMLISVKKYPNTAVCDIRINLHKAGVKVININKNAEMTRQNAHQSFARRMGGPNWHLPKGTETNSKYSESKFYGLMRQRFTITKWWTGSSMKVEVMSCLE